MTMRVRCTHTMGNLARDTRQIPVKAARESARIVRRNAEKGNRRARSLARKTAGAHGKHYSRAFSAEAITPTSWEYGPEAEMLQGGMSFEDGSRNQPAHHDLLISSIQAGEDLERDVRKMLDGLFWP